MFAAKMFENWGNFEKSLSLFLVVFFALCPYKHGNIEAYR